MPGIIDTLFVLALCWGVGCKSGKSFRRAKEIILFVHLLLWVSSPLGLEFCSQSIGFLKRRNREDLATWPSGFRSQRVSFYGEFHQGKILSVPQEHNLWVWGRWVLSLFQAGYLQRERGLRSTELPPSVPVDVGFKAIHQIDRAGCSLSSTRSRNVWHLSHQCLQLRKVHLCSIFATLPLRASSAQVGDRI